MVRSSISGTSSDDNCSACDDVEGIAGGQIESGLGIGLTIVRSLIELHGGGIEVHSSGHNQGSEFRVTLPVLTNGEPKTKNSTDISADAASHEKLNVLLVDDNQAAAEMLRMVVGMLGHHVNLAFDGKQAIEAAEKFRPDIILMDIGMPVMNGNEAARHIRQQSWGKDMTLIALTGWGQEEDRRRTREAGFDKHLVKPADPTELQNIFKQHNQNGPGESR